MYARRKGKRAATAILAVFLMTSCSALNPHVQVPDEKNLYNGSPTLNNAIKYAYALRSEYRGAISDQYYVNSGVGVALVSMTSVAAFLGVISEGSTAIPALAAGGAGLYGASKLVANVDQQMIYAVGANSVSCVLATYEPLYAQIYGEELESQIPAEQVQKNGEGNQGSKAGGQKPKPRLTMVQGDIDQLKIKADEARAMIRQMLSPQGPSGNSAGSPDAIVSEVYLSRLKVAEQSGVRARAALDIAYRASGRLMADIQAVQASVDIALVKSTPKIEDVITIIGTAVPTLDKLPKKEKANKLNGLEQSQSGVNVKLNMLVDEVEAIAARLEAFALSIVEPASSDIVEKCTAGLEKAIPALTASPDTGIDLPATAGARGDARISGGKLPYSPPRWLGLVPLESVLELRSDISGVVSVIVKDPAKAAGNYIFAVSDISGGSVSVDVRVAAPTAPASQPADNTGSGSTTTKTEVVALQKALISQNCLTAKAKDGSTNADGDWGVCTTNALTKLVDAAKVTSAIDQCPVALTGLDRSWLDRNQGKTAELAACLKDAQCPAPVSDPESCKAP